MKSDSVVQCTGCGKKRKVNFTASMKKGWPKCCAGTMRLITDPTRKMIGDAIAEVMAPLVEIRKALRPRQQSKAKVFSHLNSK